MVVNASWLDTQHYKVGIKVKGSNPGKEVTPFCTPRYSSYYKRNLRVTPDYSWVTY